MILRVVNCDVCGKIFTEEKHGEGFPGWGQFMGISLDGIDNPYLCPEHLAKVATFIDEMKGEYRGVE
jgi:hypothetical protein